MTGPASCSTKRIGERPRGALRGRLQGHGGDVLGVTKPGVKVQGETCPEAESGRGEGVWLTDGQRQLAPG